MVVDPNVIVASRKYVDDKFQIVSTNLTNIQQQLTQHLDESGHFVVGVNGTQSIPNNIATNIFFNKEILSENNIALLQSDGTIKITEAGDYEFFCAIEWSSNNAGERLCEIGYNAGPIGSSRVAPSLYGNVTQQTSTVVTLPANAIIAVSVLQTSGETLLMSRKALMPYLLIRRLKKGGEL